MRKTLAQGGLTPLEAIRCATLHGAEYLGLDKDVGSLEAGKLADLMLMDKNPLENIRNSESIRFVMINVVLYRHEQYGRGLSAAEAEGEVLLAELKHRVRAQYLCKSVKSASSVVYGASKGGTHRPRMTRI